MMFMMSNPNDDFMPLTEHLGELRKRIIWIALVLTLSMIAGFLAAKPVLTYLKKAPPANGIEWNVFSPWEALRIYMQISFTASLLVTLPFALYLIWSFAKPGLRAEEQKAALQYIPYTILMFLLGLGFAYFIVFPLAFQYTSSLTRSLNLTETYGISQYFSFMFNILLPLSLLFELPIVMMFLTRIRLLNPMRLRKMRRYAYMALLIMVTFITPPDVFSVLMVTFPLILLYELSIIFSRSIYSKQLAKVEQIKELGCR